MMIESSRIRPSATFLFAQQSSFIHRSGKDSSV